MIGETVSLELYKKACAERDAFRDLCARMAVSFAVQRYGVIGTGKNVVVGDYVFRVFIADGEPRAEVVPQ